jgi:hypothetical protein
MKNNILKYISYLACFSVAVVSIFSCTEEIEGPDVLKDKDGAAVIHYVRVTDPQTSDSLLTGAFLGSLVAIIGDNLGDTKELYFNDQKALLNPTYITDKSIIVNVPTTVPTEVTNEMKLIFSDQSELTHPFTINVPAPVIKSIKSEYVPAGGIAEIQGDFFFDPIKVVFPGGVEGTIVSLDKTEIKVEVPEGAQPGNIKVTTNFGSSNSSFIFRDDRNILLDFDNFVHETWTARLGYNDVPGITPVDGNFAYFKSDNHGAWQWVNEMTMQYWAPRGRGAVPIANGIISDLVFKMEVNIPVAWEDVRMEIFFAPSAESEGRGNPNVAIYRWAPFVEGPFKTDGWETFEFPLTEFVHNTANDDPSQSIDDLSGLSNITMMVFGPASGTVPILIAFDNLRVVPK